MKNNPINKFANRIARWRKLANRHNRHSMTKWLSIAVLLLAGLNTSAMAQTQIGERSGRVEWGGWELDYNTFTKNDGLTLHSVKFNGAQILGRASFPVMSVYYQNNRCGPYADRLNGPQSPVSWANNAKLVAREFTQNGKQWFELGIREFIGSYDIYQSWYFSADGELDGHVFSRGIQCSVYHEHFPMFRLDFDIDGPANDRIIRQTGASSFSPMSAEFQENATAAYQHGWFVEDTITGRRVKVDFDDGAWNVAGTVVPETAYAQNRVGGMLNRTSEEAWPGSPSKDFPYRNNENIDGADVVMWYRGFLPHYNEEGNALWHSTGVHITADQDSDGDGLLDSVDPDDDNDGVLDVNDDLPLDPNESVDTDGDGIGNNADTDDDNDGVADTTDVFPLDANEWADTDRDGQGDNADLDADNDGIPDALESGDGMSWSEDFSGLANNASQDTGSTAWSLTRDNDGTTGVDASNNRLVFGGGSPDQAELTTETIDVSAYGNANFDIAIDWSRISSNIPDAPGDFFQIWVEIDGTEQRVFTQDTTWPNQNEMQQWTGSFRAANTLRIRIFSDISISSEKWAIAKIAISSNNNTRDTDNDGVNNQVDLDSDNDGLYDVVEAGGIDANHDGFIDTPATNQGTLISPPDSDSDNLPDYLDLESSNAANNGAGPFDITNSPAASLDDNGDGMVNGDDAQGGTDANGNGIDDAIEAIGVGVDTDGDGIPDTTDPDDDNDGVLDVDDDFPLDANESVDTDGDGTGNNADTDDDGDGVLDTADAFPLDANESLDTDGDGAGNNADTDDDNDGVLDVADAFPLDASESVDTDGDGIGNNADTDDDNDGTPDHLDPAPLDPTIGATQCNRISNGVFETNLDGWESNVTPTLTSDAHGGTMALNFGGGWVSTTIPVGSAAMHSVAGFYKTSGTTGWIGFGMDFVDATGQEVGEAIRSLPYTDTYTEFSLEGQVPASASYIRLWFYADGTTTLTLDDLDLRKTGCTSGGGEVNQAPSVANPGTQASETGEAAQIQISATDAENDSLTYSATGLPTGMTIDAQSGLISGTPGTVATTQVVVTVSDAQNSTNVSFYWSVSEPGTTTPCNALTNPGFEIGYEGWATSAVPVLTTDAAEGNQALHFGAGWISTTVPGFPSTEYMVTGSYQVNNGSGWTGFGMDFLDETGAEVGESVRSLDPATNYASFQLNGTTPANATQVRLWFYADTDRTITVDALDLREASCQ